MCIYLILYPKKSNDLCVFCCWYSGNFQTNQKNIFKQDLFDAVSQNLTTSLSHRISPVVMSPQLFQQKEPLHKITYIVYTYIFEDFPIASNLLSWWEVLISPIEHIHIHIIYFYIHYKKPSWNRKNMVCSKAKLPKMRRLLGYTFYFRVTINGGAPPPMKICFNLVYTPIYGSCKL